MDAKKRIEIEFNSDESQIYDKLVEQSQKKGMPASEYIKDLIKKDLAWGHFTRRNPRGKRRQTGGSGNSELFGD